MDDPNADFSSINQALSSLTETDKHYRIYLAKGVYHERIELKQANLELIGEDKTQTIICASCCNQDLNVAGKISGTYGSATVSIEAQNVGLSNLTIRNDFSFVNNQLRSQNERIIHTQAVALLVGYLADQISCQNICLESYHDTLFLAHGKSYFENCQVKGAIDFIFGAGQAFFYHSQIIAIDPYPACARSKPVPYGFIAAPSTPINQNIGFIFYQCQLLKAKNVPDKVYAFGRPWHPTRVFDDPLKPYADPDAIGHCGFYCCDIDTHLYGWEKMSGIDKTQEITWFYPESSRFEEYQNTILGRYIQRQSAYLITESRYQQRLLEMIKVYQDWCPAILKIKD